jgi:DNA-binding beta-propeller fold protein YncE
LFAGFSIKSVIVVVIIGMISAVIIAAQGNNNFINSFLMHGKQLSAKALPSSSSSFSLTQTIAIPNVNGRIDHMAIDIKGQKLFVAELENNSLDVVDLKAAKRIHSISNNNNNYNYNNRLLNEPQAVVFIPELNRIFVSNGQDGTVDVFDAKSFGFIKKIKLPSDDADNMRYDPSSKLVYVGYGEGSLGIINATNYNIIGNIRLSGHPESFQIEGENGISGQNQRRIFVNVPQSNSIEVVDSQKRMISKTWTITNPQNNFPMALDEVNHRLFVGTRDPPKLMVFDTNSGKVVTILDTAMDSDDIFYDATKKRIYVSCGEGFVNVFQQQEDANHYHAIATVTTAQGARTSLFVPELHSFYLAVPHIGNQESKILVYQVA